MKLFAVCIGPLMALLLVQLIDASEESVSRRSSGDKFLDPCKAAGYLGDAALTEAQVSNVKRWIMKQSTDERIFETLEDDVVNKKELKEVTQHHEELQALVENMRQELRNKLNEKNKTCTMIDKKLCRQMKIQLNDDILNIRIKWMRLKNKQKLLKQKLRELNANEGSDKLETQSLKRNNIRPVTECKSTDVNSTCDKRNTQSENENRRNVSGHSRSKRGAINNENRLWSYGVIPYIVDNVFSSLAKTTLMWATRLWEHNTCIIFKEKEPEDTDYIVFTKSMCGCCSFVGRSGGGQAISIGQDCEVQGIVAHELGHVIGFYHEHTRPDRDNYITVVNESIQVKEMYNFNKQHDINSLNETYDYDSLMHYSRGLFATASGLDTIVPHLQPGALLAPRIGQRSGPSEGDIRQVNKLYRCPECGGTFHDHTGTLSYLPHAGKPDICQWRIVAAHGEKIHLNVAAIDLPDSANCETDYLEVRDGPYMKSPLIKRLCGNQVPGLISSTGRRMWIELRTSSGNGQGVNATYAAECGGEMISDEGMLVSPNYPDSYPSRKECVWKITVAENFNVGVMFDHFELQFSAKCRRDHLEFRDGPNENSSLIGKVCGSLEQEDFLTTGRHLYVKFFSDRMIQKSGFSLRFVKEIDECNTDDHGCDQVCHNTYGSYHCECRLGFQLHSDGKRCEPACGGILGDYYGNITSPSHPDLYPADRKCAWTINAPPGYRIHLNFTYFDVEALGQGCHYDSVTVRSDVHGEVYGEFCGYEIPPPIVSKGNTMRIDFISDKSVQNTGFFAHFVQDRNECTAVNGGCDHICKNTIGSYTCECRPGFFLDKDKHTCKETRCHFESKKESGFIRSTNFPEHYPSRENCSWHVSTVEGHRIRLTFEWFEVEPHDDCEYDYVTVYDGNRNTAPVLDKICGHKLPEPITSNGSSIFVNFISDDSVQRIGFNIAYDVACGADLVATEQEKVFVSHPGYGKKLYHPRQDCQWAIRASSPGFIQLRFTHFELESQLEGQEECIYDLVTVYDGLLNTGRVLGEFCGLDVPDPILSSRGNLLVHFISDDTINRKGFSLAYKLVSALIHH